jgi:hypothetical protein
MRRVRGNGGRMARLTPSHIVAISLLVLTVSCSAGALLALIFSALQLFPTSIALTLFRECVGAGFASGMLAARRLRG